jgi:hypothetical protein
MFYVGFACRSDFHWAAQATPEFSASLTAVARGGDTEALAVCVLLAWIALFLQNSRKIF